MKHVHYFTKSLLMAGFSFWGTACSNDDLLNLEQEQQKKQQKYTMKMQFIGDVAGFDQNSSQHTRTTTSSWSDGDKIYITFYNGSTIIPGEAIYSSSSGWSVSYEGELATGTDLKCEARYFVNATFSSASLVSLNSNSEIYEDVNATYAYSNGSLTVQATLSPKTGRIRFTGSSGVTIHTTGFSVYTTFAPEINTFSSSNAMITSTVASDGSTPYVYGEFSNEDRIIGIVGSDFAYTRICTSDMLNIGESGYMAIPSETSHNNWRSGLYIKVSGVEFKMIPVVGYSEGFFLIGETEVTESLYNTVNGSSSSSNLPKDNISKGNINSFISKINNITNLNFALPSSEQWLFAAKGGNKSQNYTYCGSNIPGDVAWYSGNTNEKHPVKTKAPNELGIYDMSGNVAEMATSNSTSYGYCYHGGDYSSSESGITTTYKYIYGSYGYGYGFRLVLTCP